ncbi:MAG: SlyX family protein [Gammaproteobacteria bacterium]|nr:SlyX family protein [Gammaproteobacteria bacterium]
MSGGPEERLEALEVKIAYQEQAIAELNEVIVAQQRRLDELEARCQALRRELQSLAAAGGTEADIPEPPPHY